MNANPQFLVPNQTPTIGNATIGVASGLISAADPLRMSETITNDSTGDMYIAFGVAAVLNKGILLGSGQSLTYGLATSIPWIGIVNGIGGAANLNVAIATLKRVQGR